MNADRGDAARRVLRDAAGRETMGDAERALPPRSTGINLDMDVMLLCLFLLGIRLFWNYFEPSFKGNNEMNNALRVYDGLMCDGCDI